MDGIIDVLSGSRLSNKEEPLETFRNLVKRRFFSVIVGENLSLCIYKIKNTGGLYNNSLFLSNIPLQSLGIC